MSGPIVIVGSGLAGWTVAREFRKLDSDTPVLLVTADGGDFYAKPSLSNAFAQRRRPEQLVSTPAAAMAEKLGVRLLAHTRVEAIEPERATLRAGDEIRYRALVLATGARPISVPIGGDAAGRVLSVNSLDDFGIFHERLQGGGPDEQRDILILGAGLIGCEFANDLVTAGHRVQVVDPAPRPLAALLPPEPSEALRDALAAQGVSWHFGATVEQLVQSDGKRLTATLSNGKRIEADLVLSAIGLRPDLTLAQRAGLACECGIVVDRRLRTSAPHVFALGDCAQYAAGNWDDAHARPSGGMLLPYVMPIMNAARTLAAQLASVEGELTFPLMPVTVKTPALPLVIVPPQAGVTGGWHLREEGVWEFLCDEGKRRGFVLTGKQTGRRAELSAGCYAG